MPIYSVLADTKNAKIPFIKDGDTLSEQLHQLKGTAGNFGYPMLSSLAEEMEVNTEEKNKEELVLNFIELRSTYQKIVLGLDNAA